MVYLNQFCVKHVYMLEFFFITTSSKELHLQKIPRPIYNIPVDQQYYLDCGNIAEINKNSILQIQYYR